MGFETLPGAITAPPTSTLLPNQVAWDGQAMTDEAALGMVLGDVLKAEAFIQSKNVPIDLENFDNLYRALPSGGNWPGTESRQASLTMPVIMEAVEKLVASIFLAFFSDKQPFLMEPMGLTSPLAARANAKVAKWAVKTSGFKEEIRKMLKSCLLYGFCAAGWGWCTDYMESGQYEMEEANPEQVKRKSDKKEYSYPTFENVELRNILFDPSLREQDCRKGRYVIRQFFIDASELDDLRDDPTYKNIPSREELVQILAANSEPTADTLKGSKQITWRDNQAAPQDQTQSIDPLKQPLEILQYVTEDRVISVLQRVIVIRNGAVEGDLGHLSCAFIDVPGAMYGFGVGKLLSGEQLLQTSVVRAWLNSLALALNPAFTEQKGLGAGAQQVKVSPGKILTSVGQLTQIKIDPMTEQAMNAINSSENRATRRVGANGGDNMPTQALRTAEGVNSFNQGIVDKLQYFIEIFSEMVFIPALEAFVDMCKRKLQPAQLKEILTDEDGQAFQGNILDVYNAKCSIQTLSSTKLAARRAAAQLAPLLMQLVQGQAVQDSLASQNKKFDYTELLDEIVDLTGWDINSLVVDATPEDIARHMQMQTGAQKAAGEAQLAAQQHQYKMEEIEAQGEAHAGNTVIKHILAESGNDNSLAGIPNG